MAAPSFPRLNDAHGRVARSLRVSVTDRCNLRCVYCMPEQPRWLPKDDILSFEELVRVCRVAALCGVEKVRITGGEPLARKGVPELVRMLKEVPGIRELAMTSNGMLLPRHAQELKAAGLDRLTVSLDTLVAERFLRINRRPGLEETLRGMDAAEKAGFSPLKVNAVVMRGMNDDEVGALARWGRHHGRLMRFIEFMPLEGDRNWTRERVVPASEILERVRANFPFRPMPGAARTTAELHEYEDGGGAFGVIASVTRPFCEDCDRIRITADGGLRTCLFAQSALDLRGPMRAGAADAELAALLGGAVRGKGPGHLIDLPGFRRPDRAMNAIGG